MTSDITTELIGTDGTASDAPLLRARIRWAGIVWGFVLGTLAFSGLWILASAQRREDVAAWLSELTVPSIVGVSVLALGALLLVAGLVGLLRRAQRSLAPAPDRRD